MARACEASTLLSAALASRPRDRLPAKRLRTEGAPPASSVGWAGCGLQYFLQPDRCSTFVGCLGSAIGQLLRGWVWLAEGSVVAHFRLRGAQTL